MSQSHAVSHLLVAAALAAASLPVSAQERVLFEASDGSPAVAHLYASPVGTAPTLVVALHQGGGDARGEYSPIVPRLLQASYDVLAVDLREGGDRFGGVNETRALAAREGRPGNGAPDYCGALPDVRGAITAARRVRPGASLVLWGSSFSGALALRAAAEGVEGFVAVLAFSPASGGPMAACQGEEVSHAIDVPVLALRPAAEMEVEAVRRQAVTLRSQGHRVYVADPGAHGSSMLVGERVGGDTGPTWDVVLEFLAQVAAG